MALAAYCCCKQIFASMLVRTRLSIISCSICCTHIHTRAPFMRYCTIYIYIYFTWDTVWPAVYVHTTSWIVLLIAWRVLFQAFGYWTIECVSLLQNFDQLFDSMLVFFTCIFKWEKSTSKIAPTKFISNKWNEQRKFAVQNGKKLN